MRIILGGLPYSCNETDVVNFFKRGDDDQEIGVTPLGEENGVLMIRRGFQNNPTGDAFVLFYDSTDASLALKKHRAEIDDVQTVADEDGAETELVRRRYVEVFRSTAAELHQVRFKLFSENEFLQFLFYSIFKIVIPFFDTRN